MRFPIVFLLVLLVGPILAAAEPPAEPTREQRDAAREAFRKVDGYDLDTPYFPGARPIPVFGLRIEFTTVSEDFVRKLPEVPFRHGLILSGKNFTGEGLRHLKSRKNLVGLYISQTSIADAGLKELATLESLEMVYLWYSRQLTNDGLKILTGMKHVKALNIGGSLINNDGLKHLATMPQLEHLWISHLELNDPGLKHLKDLVNLKGVSLMENRALTHDGLAAFLGNIKSLEYLDLSHVKGTDATLKEIARHKTLKGLNVFNSSAITDEGIRHLADLADMEYLGLVGTQMTDQGLKHLLRMEKLHTLHIGGTRLTDAAVDDLVKFKKLRDFWFPTSISKPGKERFKKAFPDCRIID